LLDRRGLERAPSQGLDVGGDVLGADVADVSGAALLTPRHKQQDLTDVGTPGVAVPDRGDEKVDEVPGGVLAGGGDECRYRNGASVGSSEGLRGVVWQVFGVVHASHYSM
jgi:hypothetical protein